MLVSFDFICDAGHKQEIFFSTVDYPDRKFPNFIPCCEYKAERIKAANMDPDPYWSGKEIKSLGINTSSRSYLKKYLKTNGLTQLTTEDRIGHKSKNKRLEEHLAKPEVKREREKIISETLDSFGVIDKAI